MFEVSTTTTFAAASDPFVAGAATTGTMTVAEESVFCCVWPCELLSEALALLIEGVCMMAESFFCIGSCLLSVGAIIWGVSTVLGEEENKTAEAAAPHMSRRSTTSSSSQQRRREQTHQTE